MLVVALLFVLIGSQVPVPGINAESLAAQSIYGDASWSVRYSILALGTLPILTVLAYAEIVGLLIPPLARWQAASLKNARRLRVILALLIFAVTAAQGFGIFLIFITMGLVALDTVAMVTCLLSFVAVSAILIWLIGNMRFPGVDDGLWCLVAVFALSELPSASVTLFEILRVSELSAGAWAVLILALVVGLVAGVFLLKGARRVLRRPVYPGGPRLAVPLAILLWPPFLVSIVGEYVLQLAISQAPHTLSRSPWLLDIIMLAGMIIFIPLVVYGYLRSDLAGRTKAESNRYLRTVLAPVAGAQILICVGFALGNLLLGVTLFPKGPIFITVICVAWALFDLVTKRHASQQA